MNHASVPLGPHDVYVCGCSCMMAFHPSGAHGFVLKLCFSCSISYADLVGSSLAMWSMLRESLVCSKSWSHSCIRKFGSVEYKPLMK